MLATYLRGRDSFKLSVEWNKREYVYKHFTNKL